MRAAINVYQKRLLTDGVGLMLDTQLPNLIRRLSGCWFRADGLTISNGEKNDKYCIEEILQNTWDSANDRFY